MTKLLEQALDVVRAMPPSEQDNIADVILSMARIGGSDDLDPEDLRDALDGLAQVDRGEIATPDEIDAAFRRFRQ